MFAGDFAPRGWAFCSGQILSIAQNTALFSLVGATYGGNGQTTFALPDLRARAPVHPGQGPGLSGYNLGQAGGTVSVTLNVNQMPAHTHTGATRASSGGANDRRVADQQFFGVRQPIQHHRQRSDELDLGANRSDRRQSAALKYSAVLGNQFYYRAPRHFPFAQLTIRTKFVFVVAALRRAATTQFSQTVSALTFR